MSVLIGGSGSTGSSLLRQILNRHSLLFCGPETSLFCKQELYDDWSDHKSQLLLRGSRGLRSNSWHIYRGTDLIKEEIGVKEEKVQSLISNADGFPEFCDKLFSIPLAENNKKLWLEKTPGNTYGFESFLNTFEQGKVVHIFRNPYDTIASLVGRGYSPYYAAGIYLLNTSFGLSQRKNLRCHELSYEKLVRLPTVTVMDICRFLNIGFEESMITGSSKKFEDDQTQIGEWSYDETDKIGEGSIGKFDRLPTIDREVILQACMSVKIKPAFAKKHNLLNKSIEDLCPVLGYDFISQDYNARAFRKLQSQKIKDLILRTRKWAHYNPINYPLSLSPNS